MKRSIYILIYAALLTACEFRPLEELNNVHYVRVYINEQIKNVTTGFYNEDYERPEYESPAVMKLSLADPQTGEIKAERYLKDIGYDNLGMYYEGYIIADPGTYTAMAYNFDTRVTKIDGAGNHKTSKGYTNTIAPHIKTRFARSKDNSSDEKEVYDPDHLFVARCGNIPLGYRNQVDTLMTPEGEWLMAESLVKSYFLQIRIKGAQYISSTAALITGMSGSAWLYDGRYDPEDQVSVYFEMTPGETSSAGLSSVKSSDEAILYTTFNTFGKLPDKESRLIMTFNFKTIFGSMHMEEIDITDIFKTEEAINNQWLLIDHIIEIPGPPPINNEGMAPTVGKYDEIHTEIII